jgi:hypothetical protein
MTIRPQSARSKQCGMNLFELIVFVVCVAIAANFSVYMASSHHWLVGVLTFPLGFCSAAYVISSLGEIAVRCGYRRAGRTPGILIRRSLLIGTICGVVMGGCFTAWAFLGLSQPLFTARTGCFCQRAFLEQALIFLLHSFGRSAV